MGGRTGQGRLIVYMGQAPPGGEMTLAYYRLCRDADSKGNRRAEKPSVFLRLVTRDVMPGAGVISTCKISKTDWLGLGYFRSAYNTSTMGYWEQRSEF